MTSRAHITLLIAFVIAGIVAVADVRWSLAHFGVVAPIGPLIDFMIVAYGTVLLLKLQWRLYFGAAFPALLFIGGTYAMMVKYAYMWSPVSFGDLLLVPDLIGFYGTAPRIATGIVAIVLAGLFLCNLRLPRREDLPMFALVPLVAILLVLKIFGPGFAVPAALSDTSPLQLGQWGALAVSTYQFADRYADARRLSAKFGEQRPYPDFTATTVAGTDHRNVYIILVESLFNPHEIGGVTFDRDPLAPPFDAWARSGGAHGMSPVFGGRSADAEFEVLCGLPAGATDGPVIFAQLTASKIDCLPAKLGRLGWTSISMVPVPSSFFSAGRAYVRFGFDRSIFIDQIDTSDLDDSFVSAQSLLEQLLAKDKELLATQRPFLSYTFLVSGHFPYPLNEARRPKLVHVAPHEPMVEDYVNTVYYNTLAVGQYIAAVRKLDPTALIVTLGDHPPVLNLEQPSTDYPGQARLTHQVPLLIFDGQQGELPLTGWVPDYQIPEIILDKLTNGSFCRANKCYEDAAQSIRPTATGLTVIDAGTKQFDFCEEATPACAAAKQAADFWRLQIDRMTGLQ
jgi:phosphoglycerol transferase MdoB-like AlkP superfamily enzyme